MTNRLLNTLLGSALFIASLVALPMSANAETTEINGQVTADSLFGQFVRAEQTAQFRGAIAVQEDNTIGVTCAEPAAIRTQALRVLQPVTINEGDARPTAGLWIERFEVERCDRSRVYNVIYEIQEDGIMSVLPAAPGTSGQPFQLLREIRGRMINQAALGGCTNRGVLNVTQGVPDGYAVQIQGGEYDTWTILGCGQAVNMIVLYTYIENDGITVSVEAQQPTSVN